MTWANHGEMASPTATSKFEVVAYEVHDDQVVVCGRLTTSAGTVTAFGGAPLTRGRDGRSSAAEALNAATRDALTKATELAQGGSDPVSEATQQRPPMPAISDRLTSRQLNAILGSARRRSIERDRLTSMIEERFRKPELAQLTRREASTLIAELSAANGTHP